MFGLMLFGAPKNQTTNGDRSTIPKFYRLFLFIPNKRGHTSLLKSSFEILPFFTSLLHLCYILMLVADLSQLSRYTYPCLKNAIMRLTARRTKNENKNSIFSNVCKFVMFSNSLLTTSWNDFKPNEWFCS